MLSIDYIKTNKNKVINASKNKGYPIDNKLIEDLIKLDEERIKIIQNIQNINQQRNKLSSEKINSKDKEKAIELKKQLRVKELKLKDVEIKLSKLIYQIPNVPQSDIKIGKSENDNEILRKFKDLKKFDFKIKDHLEIGENLDLIDVKRASKISGTRFGYLKNQAAILEFAIVKYALDLLLRKGFLPVIPPVLIKKDITEKLGYWQAGEHNQYYLVKEPEIDEGLLYLIGTAEHSLVPMHQDEILNINDLPKRYAGFSTCFRREAGTYGKDTRGIFRVHQFDKVEMVSITTKEKDDEEFEFLLSVEEELYKGLDIPYRVSKMCTTELGFPAAKKIDLEAWIPSQNKYREITSVSTTTDFQARRLKIKYKTDNNKAEYVHILNATGCAIGRTIIAILENYQQKDGSVAIPKVLQKYTGFNKISKS
jgi:seryl-tRNA synthetase